jgi:hypothetical protein
MSHKPNAVKRKIVVTLSRRRLDFKILSSLTIETSPGKVVRLMSITQQDNDRHPSPYNQINDAALSEICIDLYQA